MAVLDLARLARLQELLGTGRAEIVATVVTELGAAVGQLERALDAHDGPGAALAAHAARNSALMVGAADLLSALRVTEQSARAGDLETALDGLAQVRCHWPVLRARLEVIARES